MNKVKIIASVPTIHTMYALALFGLNTVKLLDGSITGELEFASIEAAKEHLVSKARKSLASAKEYIIAHRQINKHNYLELSDVRAEIVMINHLEQEQQASYREGPWYAKDGQIYSTSGDTIAHVLDSEQQQANAQLIANSPALIDTINNLLHTIHATCNINEQMHEAIVNAEYAVELATRL